MENLFQMNFSKNQVNAISNLGLAHLGDCVFEILCRAYLCTRGDKTVDKLHRDTINMVKATSQAAFADKMLPLLTEEEQAVFRRGRNANVHSIPQNASRAQYQQATALGSLFGWLYLRGERNRIEELFCIMMGE